MRGRAGGVLLAIVTALVVGIAIGLVVGGGTGEKKRAEPGLSGDGLRERLRAAEARVADLTRRVKTFSAQGVVPSFVGKRVADLETNRWVSAYKWRIRTEDRFSGRAPGTVLQQSPTGGSPLKPGRSITLVVAKKAPVRPKRWVTVRTLTGAGATRTRPFTVARGAGARLVYDMPENADNAIVLYRARRAPGVLLLHAIGPRRGITRLHEAGTFYLEVTGRFTIRLQVFGRR